MAGKRKYFKYIKGFFQTGTAESMMRLTMWMGVAFVVVYPFALLFKNVELTAIHVSLELGLGTIAYGAKVAQKKLSEK